MTLYENQDFQWECASEHVLRKPEHYTVKKMTKLTGVTMCHVPGREVLGAQQAHNPTLPAQRPLIVRLPDSLLGNEPDWSLGPALEKTLSPDLMVIIFPVWGWTIDAPGSSVCWTWFVLAFACISFQPY